MSRKKKKLGDKTPQSDMFMTLTLTPSTDEQINSCGLLLAELAHEKNDLCGLGTALDALSLREDLQRIRGIS